MKYLGTLCITVFALTACGDDDAVDASIDATISDAVADVTPNLSTDAVVDADATIDATVDGTVDTTVDLSIDAMTEDATPDADIGTFTERVCRSRADFAQRCTAPAVDISQCDSNPFWCALETMLLPETQDAYVACQRDRACDSDEDDCATATALSITPTAGSEVYGTDCNAKRTQCGGAVSELVCRWEVLVPAAQTLLDDCLILDCSKVGICLQSRFSADVCSQ